MKLLSITGILMLFFSISGHANEVDEAYALYEKGDYPLAASLFTKLAKQGHASAQYKLGVMYDEGRGVSKSYEQATSWYLKAAEQGHVSAQYNLGLSYDLGQGVNQSHEQAVIWYRKASEQGFAPAQYNLGSMYYSGVGVKKSEKQAEGWYRKAAEQGHASAQTNLALLYTKTQKHDKAFTWYLKAAEQGIAPAQFNLGIMYEKGYGTKQDAEQGLYWFKRAFDANFRPNEGWYPTKEKKLSDIIKKEKIEVEHFKEATKQRELIEKSRAAWSKNIELGDDTFCGPVIQVNGPMIKIAIRVQLPGYPSEAWLKRTELYPPSVTCRNINGNLHPVF